MKWRVGFILFENRFWDKLIDLIIHFDLSMSVVATGTYQMKPVLHLFENPLQAAIISGSTDNASFGLSEKTTVSVLDSNDGVYTKVEVEKSTTADPTNFSIFWLVPNQNYTVQIDLNQDGAIDCNEYEEPISTLAEGDEYFLNDGDAVILGTNVCAP